MTPTLDMEFFSRYTSHSIFAFYAHFTMYVHVTTAINRCNNCLTTKNTSMDHYYIKKKKRKNITYRTYIDEIFNMYGNKK